MPKTKDSIGTLKRRCNTNGDTSFNVGDVRVVIHRRQTKVWVIVKAPKDQKISFDRKKAG